jgi:hypothetical protein
MITVGGGETFTGVSGFDRLRLALLERVLFSSPTVNPDWDGARSLPTIDVLTLD